MDDPQIDALVRRLDVDQKIAQLHALRVLDLIDDEAGAYGVTVPDPDPTKVAEVRPHGVGHLSFAWLLDPDREVFHRQLAEIQEEVRACSPFGMAALVHGEGVSGLVHESGTQYPTAWAQAATFDPALVQARAEVTSREMREAGIHLCFSPVLDVARDLRWGRVHETYGEDPELISQMGIAFVRGINGAGNDTGVTAVAKHFTGYGASEGGLNKAAVALGRRAVRDVYAEPFRRAIAEAGLDLVMNAYGAIDGVPSVADEWLLTELLRGELHLAGAVVSDYDSINMLLTTYRTAARPAEAAAQALRAGLDVELPGNEMFTALREALDEGLVSEEHLDRAVTRVLRLKHRLGLIPGMAPAVVLAPASAAEGAGDLGTAIAAESMVLLQNDGVLPLDPVGADVLLVGPLADELRIHFGAYTAVSNREMALGIAEMMAGRVPVPADQAVFTDIFQARIPGTEAAFEANARAIHPDAPTVLGALRARHPHVRHAALGSLHAEASPVGVADVLDLVGEADVIIAVVGERTGWIGDNTAGEGKTSAHPGLPGNQASLLSALAETGRPLVTVVVTGRPLVLADAAAASSALLLAPLLGEDAGHTIVDVLTGAINPSGKLPSSFPRTLGQVPSYHGHAHGSGYDHPTRAHAAYTDLPVDGPLFAFGHGLSYAEFSLDLDDAASVTLASGEAVITATCTAANVGDRAGATVVQLYGRDEIATVVRPVRQLLAFQRVELAPGERRTVTFEVPVARLAYTMLDGARGVEAGEITVMAAFASDDIRGTRSVEVAALQL